MDAQRFADLLSDFVEIRTNYSGRGMNGKTCVGAIVGTEAHARALIIDLLAGAVDDDEREDSAKILRSGKINGMGKDYIFYFPGTSVEEAPAALPPFESREAECA
jgi:hypothetical protein